MSVAWSGTRKAAPRRARCVPPRRARIVYREAPAPSPEPRAEPAIRRRVRGRINGQVVIQFEESSAGAQPDSSHELTRKALYLVTGDTIPCEVIRIDQNGVSFKSPLSGTTFVRHDKIKAIELTVDGRGPVSLTRAKRGAAPDRPANAEGAPADPSHSFA